MKRAIVAAMLAAAVGSSLGASSADAKVVTFSGFPATTFADGVFSQNLSGDYPDGFFESTPTSAFNGFGQNNEYIAFSRPVIFNSFYISTCCGVAYAVPATFKINLYNASAGFVGSVAVTASSTPQKVSLNTANVNKVEFTFDQGVPNPYGDGRKVAWYLLSDITYDAVIEPAAWILMIVGLASVGAALRRQRRFRAA